MIGICLIHSSYNEKESGLNDYRNAVVHISYHPHIIIDSGEAEDSPDPCQTVKDILKDVQNYTSGIDLKTMNYNDTQTHLNILMSKLENLTNFTKVNLVEACIKLNNSEREIIMSSSETTKTIIQVTYHGIFRHLHIFHPLLPSDHIILPLNYLCTVYTNSLIFRALSIQKTKPSRISLDLI